MKSDWLTFFRLLLALQWRMLCRRLAALREESRLMVGVIVFFVVAYWVAGFLLFRMGFNFLSHVPGIQALLLDRMLYLFFAFLFVMLVFSNMIIGYSSLFKSSETQWLLTLPVPAAMVFQWKTLETAVLASWAFLFLSTPLMIAYGVAKQVSLWFYVKVAMLFIPFVLIPAALGAVLILVITRFLHRQVFKWTFFALATLAVAAAVLLVKPMDVSGLQQPQMVAALDQLLQNSRLAVQPLLPSYWIASSVIAWGEDWGGRGYFFFLVLLSNALMSGLVCSVASRWLFYDGWSRNQSQGNWQSGVALLDRHIPLPHTRGLEWFVGALPWLSPVTRGLILKDIRTFWRDTTQWSQFVIFFGLLGLYILNLRNVSYDWSNEFWASFVSFLNLGAASMTLATLTTRFVYPQFSLEGKRLWLLGMAPYGLKRVLLEKFWLSSSFAIFVTLSLMLLSAWMLQLPLWLTTLFAATVVLMSFALCGIAVGIGALFPNFGSGSTANRRDDNPAKIVSGFGGTFCFVASLAYIVLVIGAEAISIYAPLPVLESGFDSRALALTITWLFVCVVSLLAATIPMNLALRRMQYLEI